MASLDVEYSFALIEQMQHQTTHCVHPYFSTFQNQCNHKPFPTPRIQNWTISHIKNTTTEKRQNKETDKANSDRDRDWERIISIERKHKVVRRFERCSINIVRWHCGSYNINISYDNWMHLKGVKWSEANHFLFTRSRWTWHGMARQCKAMESKARQGKVKRCKAKRGEAKQIKSRRTLNK